jgi:hypothetical protein
MQAFAIAKGESARFAQGQIVLAIQTDGLIRVTAVPHYMTPGNKNNLLLVRRC